MMNIASCQFLRIFMAFAACRNLVLSANLFEKYPNWADFLKDPHVLRLKHYLTSPIEVLPSLLFENYTKLKVSK